MLKRLRTAHPILYCILSEVLFLGSMVVFSLLATIVLAAAGADFEYSLKIRNCPIRREIT